MEQSQAQIIVTIGPASRDAMVMRKMFEAGADIARLNFSWGKHEEHTVSIAMVRAIAAELNRSIPIIQDLSGPRVQKEHSHGFATGSISALTDKDLVDLAFGVAQKVDYIAESFVSDPADVLKLKSEIEKLGARIPVIAKIERKVAVDAIAEIIAVADAIMIARGDLGNEVPLEDIPLIEKDIITLCKKAGKPVIVATQMLFSMVNNPEPTRAEVTDVEFAILSGADVVMLSDETAVGKYPVESIGTMKKAVLAAQQRLVRDGAPWFNQL